MRGENLKLIAGPNLYFTLHVL